MARVEPWKVDHRAIALHECGHAVIALGRPGWTLLGLVVLPLDDEVHCNSERREAATPDEHLDELLVALGGPVADAIDTGSDPHRFVARLLQSDFECPEEAANEDDRCTITRELPLSGYSLYAAVDQVEAILRANWTTVLTLTDYVVTASANQFAPVGVTRLGVDKALSP